MNNRRGPMRNGWSGVKSFARSFQMLSHKSAKSSRKFDICPVASTKITTKNKGNFYRFPERPAAAGRSSVLPKLRDPIFSTNSLRSKRLRKLFIIQCSLITGLFFLVVRNIVLPAPGSVLVSYCKLK